VVLKCAVHDPKAYQEIPTSPLIPVTRRVKGYSRFVGKYVTGRRNLFRTHKVYIFFIRITSRVDLAMSVCLSVGWTLQFRKQYELGYWDLACRFLRFLSSASLFQQGATPTLTHTSRPKLWLPQFRSKNKHFNWNVLFSSIPDGPKKKFATPL